MKGWLIALVVLWSTATPAAAHLMPNSVISLDFNARDVEIEIIVPKGEIAFSAGQSSPALSPLNPFFRQHLAVTTPDGRAWDVKLRRVDTVAETFATDIRFAATLTPPAGASARALILRWDGVIDRVPNHFVLVFVRSDFAAGRLASSPEMIGALQGAKRVLRIDRGAGAPWRGFLASLRLGMAHIAEGRDHLLFLIALLLPAPLLPRGAGWHARWGDFGGVRRMFGKLALIVSAFTVGHSLTLIGGAVFNWRLPTRPVEAGIALSILVAAVHAWRPVFARREPWLAGAFGLVHGLAFATVIGDFRLEPAPKALSILGFNLGVEVVQLGVVAAALPALALAAPTPRYGGVRIALAGLAGVAALVWLTDRLRGTESVAGAAVDKVLAQGVVLLALATAAALAVRLGSPQRFASATRENS